MFNKLIKAVTALTLGVLLAGAAAYAADEPIPEGVDAPYGLGYSIIPLSDFTDGNKASWSFGGGNGGLAGIVFASGDPERGGYVLMNVISDGEKINAFQPSKETITGPLVKGDTYVYSMYAKVDKVDSYKINRVWLRDLGENKNVATKEHSIELICDGKWHYYAVPFVMKETVDKARLMIQWGAQGKKNFDLYLDDIQLRPVRKEPPLDLPKLQANKKVRFTDISGHWAEKEITEMAAMGIINGRDAETFAPDEPVTRAEIISLLVRGIGFREPRAKNPFRDSKRTDWYAKALDVMADCEIIDSGMLWQGNFFGESELKREELAMFLSNSYEKMTSSTIELIDIWHFEDKKQISDWAIPYIMRCIKMDFMDGVEWNYFAPQSTVTRAQAATAIYRLRKSVEEKLS